MSAYPPRLAVGWTPAVEAANPRVGTVKHAASVFPMLGVQVNAAVPVSEVRSYANIANSTPATGCVVRAVPRGATGDGIVIDLVDPSGNDQELSISVEGTTITVNLATGGAGAITTTGAELAAALNADDDASQLVFAVSAGTVPGAVALTDQTKTTAGAVVGDQWPEGTLWFYLKADGTASGIYVSAGETAVYYPGAVQYSWATIYASS